MLSIRKETMEVFDEHFHDVLALKVQGMLEKDFKEALEKLALDDGELKKFIKGKITEGEALGLESDSHRGAYVVLSMYRISKDIPEHSFARTANAIRNNPSTVMHLIDQY